jgi:hypothetical protein
MPTVDHQGGRSRSEIVDVLMKRIEAGRDGGILEGMFRDVFELEQPAAKPVLCATEAALFTRPPVNRAVWQLVRMPRRGDRRVSPE